MRKLFKLQKQSNIIIKQKKGDETMRDEQKCGVARCRADSEITLPDGTGLCWLHWGRKCEEKDKGSLNQAEKGKEEQTQAGDDTNI